MTPPQPSPPSPGPAAREDEAELAAVRAAALAAPEDGAAWLRLGVLLLRLSRPRRALLALRQAVRLLPGSAPAHYALAQAMMGSGQKSRDAFARAAELDPAHVEARAALASIAVRTGDAAEGRRHAEAVLALDPAHPGAATTLAHVALRAGDHAEAETRARAVLAAGSGSPINRAAAWNLLGEALHGQDRAPEAFEAWTAGNGLIRDHWRDPWEARAAARRQALARLTAHFRTTPPWPAPLAPARTRADAPRVHVFLVGFLRTGTTLLEQVLAAHDEVVALDERPTLDAASAALLYGPAGPQALEALDAESAERLRDGYWSAVRAEGVDPAGRVFVDKSPMNAVNLPAVARLFPEARVLVARRDPRDVVLSCLRRLFRPNADTWPLTDLREAAEAYARVMTLTELYLQQLPLAAREVRYETLVRDFEAETRSICGFLGLDWNERLGDFAGRMAEREVVTPSAIQLRRGLFDGGGQWRPYTAELAPAEEILRPWIEKLSYA